MNNAKMANVEARRLPLLVAAAPTHETRTVRNLEIYFLKTPMRAQYLALGCTERR